MLWKISKYSQENTRDRGPIAVKLKAYNLQLYKIKDKLKAFSLEFYELL